MMSVLNNETDVDADSQNLLHHHQAAYAHLHPQGIFTHMQMDMLLLLV
jgi:hypothetical protein